MYTPTFVDFFLFHHFFFLFVSFIFFFISSFLFSLLAGSLLHYFLSSSSVRFSTPPSLDSFLFFSSGFLFFFILVNGAIM